MNTKCVDDDEWICVFDSIAAIISAFIVVVCAQASVTKIAAQHFFVRENENEQLKHTRVHTHTHVEATTTNKKNQFDCLVDGRENCTNNKRNKIRPRV